MQAAQTPRAADEQPGHSRFPTTPYPHDFNVDPSRDFNFHGFVASGIAGNHTALAESYEWPAQGESKASSLVVNGGFSVPDIPSGQRDSQNSEYQPQELGSPFEERTARSPHVRFEPKARGPSPDSIIIRRNKRAKRTKTLEPIVTPNSVEEGTCIWLPSPIDPDRHFRDILAERPSETGNWYKVIWRDSWVHESRLGADIDQVRKKHVERFGTSWEVLADK